MCCSSVCSCTQNRLVDLQSPCLHFRTGQGGLLRSRNLDIVDLAAPYRPALAGQEADFLLVLRQGDPFLRFRDFLMGPYTFLSENELMDSMFGGAVLFGGYITLDDKYPGLGIISKEEIE